MADSWTHRVEAALSRRIVRTSPLTGGCVAEVLSADIDDGSRIVIKLDRDRSGTLADEAFMLGRLRATGTIPLPAVLAWLPAPVPDPGQPDALVMAFIESGAHLGAEGERHAADLLAALHDATVPDGVYGFDRPTRIGGLVQPNDPCCSWVEFFAQRRLIAMARQALEAGRLSASDLRRIEALASRLGRWLREPGRPSLIHGDVWGGNVLAAPCGGRVAAFIDPAIYHADPEIELAFITLFSTFGPAFFDRYAERRPIAPGFFEERRDLYNLYPLLVHTRLFGGGYAESVRATLGRFGV